MSFRHQEPYTDVEMKFVTIPAPEPPHPSRIHGTGEMAFRIREYDWSRTPLGPLVNWSESFLTAVNIMLASPNTFALYCGAGRILLYNDAYRPLLHAKHPDALGMEGSEVWKEAWNVIGPQIEAARCEGETTSALEVFIPIQTESGMRDGWFSYSFHPVYGPDGIIAVGNPGRDDTEVVIARRESERNSDQMRTILDATTDGMALIDRAWRIAFLNPAAQRMLAAVPGIIGQNIWEAFPLQVYEGSPYVYHYNRAMHDGVAGELITDYGEPLNISLKISVRPIPEGILIVFRDISEEKRATTALIETEKLAAVGKLAASIAHEINNPLESVTNLLFLARGSSAPDEVNGYLDTAERELRRVSVISNQTLRFHKQSTAPTEVTCSELFESVLTICHGRILNAGISVEKKKGAERPIACFEGEIRQVLNNLVSNAIDAMPQSGGRLLIRSRDARDWRTDRRGIALSVADSGTGMPPAVLQKIFDAFYTTKGIGGTGLGLWVSKEIVDRHHGRLLVRSSQKEGQSGTVFILFLPYNAVSR